MIQIEIVPFQPHVNFIGWRTSSQLYGVLTNIVEEAHNSNSQPWQGFYLGTTQDVALGYGTNVINQSNGNGEAYLNAIYVDMNFMPSMQQIICNGPELTDTSSSGEEKAQAVANALAAQHGITVNPASLVESLANQGYLYTGPADDGEDGYEIILPYSIMNYNVFYALTYNVVTYRRYEPVSREMTPYYRYHPVQIMPPLTGSSCTLSGNTVVRYD